MALLRAYFDESGTHAGSPFTTVSGYVMRKAQSARFCRQWSEELATASVGKPRVAQYFHMKDASKPPSGQFRGWREEDVEALARALIAQIRQRTLIGFSVVFNQSDYESILRGRAQMPSAYAFGCFALLGMVRRWADANDVQQKFSYYFEQGHDDEADANRFMAYLFGDPVVKLRYRHFSHSFVAKHDAPPLQAADMLAWHTIKSFRRRGANEPPRKDFVAMLREQDVYRHYKRDDMQRLLDALLNKGAADAAFNPSLGYLYSDEREPPSE